MLSAARNNWRPRLHRAQMERRRIVGIGGGGLAEFFCDLPLQSPRMTRACRSRSACACIDMASSRADGITRP